MILVASSSAAAGQNSKEGKYDQDGADSGGVTTWGIGGGSYLFSLQGEG